MGITEPIRDQLYAWPSEVVGELLESHQHLLFRDGRVGNVKIRDERENSKQVADHCWAAYRVGGSLSLG